MVALLRRRVSLQIMKFYWYLSKFGDSKKDIISFFLKRYKKILVAFFDLKREWDFWGLVFSLKVWFNWVLKEPIF